MRPVAGLYARAIESPQFVSLSPALDEAADGSFPGLAEVIGREQVVALHELLFGAFDNRSMNLRRVFTTAGMQAVEWTLSGVQARDWMGVPATRAPVVFEGVTLLWTAGRTISDVHTYFDVASVKAQLGAGPKELRGIARLRPPSGPPETYRENDAPRELGNASVVRRELDALGLDDSKNYLATMVGAVEVGSVEPTQAAHGKAEARAYYQRMHGDIWSLDTTITNVWGISRFVVVEYRIGGMQMRSLGWVPPRADNVVTLHMVDVVELRDEEITQIARYGNLAEIGCDCP